MGFDRRVVITGIGVIASNGNNVTEFWDALKSGKSGIDRITGFDPSEYRCQIAGEVKGFDIDEYFGKKEARGMDRFCHFALKAADEAIEMAGVSSDKTDPHRIGVLIGSGIGGLKTLEENVESLIEKGPKRVSPMLIPKMIGDMSSGLVSIRHGFRGPNYTAVSACASGTHAIGEAWWTIKRGDADIMITGGAEAAITPVGIAGFASMRAMSTRNEDPQAASRPFDQDRDGFVMAEGSGILVLESLESAQARGAEIIAEFIGYGATGDASHITAPAADGSGASRAIEMAIKHAGISKEDVTYINAHGTSTPYNDKFETLAIKNVFGDRAYKIPVSSTKSMTGHALGTAGAWETITCALAVKNNVVPPTINYTTPDPDCDLDYVPNEAREAEMNVALNINLGFGGHNATGLVKKFV
ncbi:MAG: beta-ketoacyl-ACP synthase II [Lentisphaeraceae bacterium]|nr:beta-ketoacyl-ACP synthase II [Lentisphaeraceae bacterium]